MGCRLSSEQREQVGGTTLLDRVPTPEEEEKKQKTQLLVHHVARRPPLPWEEALCLDMMEKLGKASSPMVLNPRDVRRFALQFCYAQLNDIGEDTVQRCIRRAMQINRAMQTQGFRYFRVVLANNGKGSMTGSVLKGLVMRTAETVGPERVKQNALSQAFSGKGMACSDSEDDDEDFGDLDVVENVTDDLDAVF